ncbi:MAG: Gldg family protein, partial [Chloroflexota bacterium]
DADETDEVLAPIIPPGLLLGVTGAGILIAVVILLIQGAFGVIGWASLAIALLSLVLVVVLAPQQVVNALSGRTARFGGTSILFTLLFVAALIVVYWFIEGRNWTYDVSQTDQFSLNTDNREAIETFGADPSTPTIEIIGFFDATAAANQERVEILLRDYAGVSNGKINYRFVNPDRNPTDARLYNAQPGDLVVRNTTVDDPEAAEVLPTNFGFEQVALTNSILAVSVSGDFRAYVIAAQDSLSVEDTSPAGASDFMNILVERFNWEVNEVPFVDLLAEESEFELNAAGIDDDVLVIIGGTRALSPVEAQFIADYLDNGGSLVMFAAPDIGEPSLASSEELNAYLAETFGISYQTDELILDPQQSIQSADTIVATTLTRTNFITQGVPQGLDVVIAQLARSITIAETPPANVQTFDLVRTSNSSYAKSFDELQAEEIQPNDEDPRGPLTILAAAENTDTGARVVLFGSDSIPANQFGLFQEAANIQLAFGSLVWATNFDQFVEQIPQVTTQEFNPADTPVIADTQQLNLINMLTLFVLPFGVLGIGAVVWAFRRE